MSEAERQLYKELEAYLNKRASRMSEIERLIPFGGEDYTFIRMLWEKMFWREKAIELAERTAMNCETLTQHEVDMYVQQNGVKCPYCESDDLHCGEWDTQDSAVFRSVTCGKCASTWMDEYRLVGISEG